MKHKDLVLAHLQTVQLLTRVTVTTVEVSWGMDLLWAKGTAKVIQLQNRSSNAGTWTSYSFSDWPPELPSLPQYAPQDQENTEKWGY